MTTRFLIFSIVCLILLNVWWCNRPVRSAEIPAINHGADMITTDWHGQQVAYKWCGNKYVVMWVRE
jgi:hypothetical protein